MSREHDGVRCVSRAWRACAGSGRTRVRLFSYGRAPAAVCAEPRCPSLTRSFI